MTADDAMPELQWPADRPPILVTREMIEPNPFTLDTYIRQVETARWNAFLLQEARDLGLACRTWLPDDFDPVVLHRRDGWALRRYRGEHRHGTLTVADVIADVIADAPHDRSKHQRSLRRKVRIFIGPHEWSGKFYGVVPAVFDLSDATGTAISGVITSRDGDAVTGPIIIESEGDTNA